MPVSKIKIDALITGQIRDSKIFMLSIGSLIRLRSKGVFRNVILSTWSHDIEKHSELISALRNEGVIIVINYENHQLKSVGNYCEQVKTFANGLNKIEDSAFVFKTRPDILHYGGDETIEKIIEENIAIPANYLEFEYRIWAPSFVGIQPFFIADQCFMGLAGDLRKFTNFDTYIEVNEINIPLYPGSKTHPSAASAEIRFWMSPFIAHFPIFHEYKKIWPLSMNGHSVYQKIQYLNLHSTIYREYLSLYWFIIDKLFSISEGKFCIANGFTSNGNIIVRANSHSSESINFIDEISNPDILYPTSFSTDRSLKKYISSEYKNTTESNLFCKAYYGATNYKKTIQRMTDFESYLNDLSIILNFDISK